MAFLTRQSEALSIMSSYLSAPCVLPTYFCARPSFSPALTVSLATDRRQRRQDSQFTHLKATRQYCAFIRLEAHVGKALIRALGAAVQASYHTARTCITSTCDFLVHAYHHGRACSPLCGGGGHYRQPWDSGTRLRPNLAVAKRIGLPYCSAGGAPHSPSL